MLTSLRKTKIFNMALFDIVATFLLSVIIHLLLWNFPLEMNKKKRTYQQFFMSLSLMFIMCIGIGVIFHRIFGIQSALSAYIGLNDMPRLSNL